MNNNRFKPDALGLVPINDDEIFVTCTYPTVKENMYLISNYGRIFSIYSKKILIPIENEKGYLKISLQLDKDIDKKHRSYKSIKVHRLVAYEFCDNYNKDYDVNHKNSIRSCNYYKNLEWLSHHENIVHASKEGNMYDKNSELFIREICNLMQSGTTIFDIYYLYRPNEKRRYKSFSDKKFYTFLYLIATNKRHQRIRSEYNIDIEKVYPRYNKKIKSEDINKIIMYIEKGLKNMEIMNLFGYKSKSDNPSLYRFIVKKRQVQRLSKG